jgi:RecA/RadA recombinase
LSHKLADLMKKMQKEHGPGSFKVASDTDPYCPRIPTGIFSLDYAMGGGIPIGRTSMFYGKRSAGKSAACAKTAANAQRLCRKCYGRVITQDKEVTVERKTVDLITGKMQVTEEKIVKKTPVDCVNKCRVVVEGKKVFPGRMQVIWVDAEGTFTPDFYMKFGVDCDDLMLATPDYGEAAVDMVDSAIRLRAVDLIIVDSIAHLTPLKEREGSTEDSLVAVQARLVNRAMRQWTSSLNEVESNKENDCAILLVNQIREKMGGFYTAEVRPGGMGQAFATSLDIHLWQKDFKYDSTGRPLWMTSKFIVEKNRVSVPKMEGTYRMCLLDHPGRLAGDTWDDEAVADAVLDRGFATFDDKGGVSVIGRPFASSDEFRAEIAKREDFYYEAREAVLNFMIYQPSDGKLAEKKKKGDKDGKDDKGGKDDAQEE